MNRKPPILFLDIDGVLNSVQFYIKRAELHSQLGTGLHSLDPLAVRRLEWICDATNCEIVIMSTWRRIHSINRIVELFKIQGYFGHPPIIDATPIFSDSTDRGYEVLSWLNALPMRGADRIYCCVDDDRDFLPTQPLVHVNNEFGLTDYDAERCINILKRR